MFRFNLSCRIFLTIYLRCLLVFNLRCLLVFNLRCLLVFNLRCLLVSTSGAFLSSTSDGMSFIFSFDLFSEELVALLKVLSFLGFVLLLPLLVVFLGVSDLVYNSLKSTNSIIAISALSPILLPSLIILV